MIAVDTSALMAVLLGEPQSDACAEILATEDELLISAATVAESLIVATRRNLGDEMARIIDGLGMEVVGVTAATSRRVAQAYSNWGKGMHPAALNFGDCFAYDVARERGCPLLFVGGDFALTDVKPALVHKG